MNIEKTVLKLNQLKKERKLTLKQLAEKSGLSLGTVNKIMSGALLGIKADKLQKLANALDVSSNVFLEETPETPTAKTNFGLVKVACISPEIIVANCRHNAEQVVAHAKKANANGVRIALFPELCLTGYSCGDLFFQHALRTSALEALHFVTDSLKNLNTIVVVGLPLADDAGKLFNVAAVLYQGKILGIVPKTHLPTYNEFHEKRWFCTPQGNTTVTIFGEAIPFGTELLFADSLAKEFRFAVEICEDMWTTSAPSNNHTLAGANMILNLSASNETVDKSDFRKKVIEVQSSKTNCIYAYCSAGPSESTSQVVFSAHNIICENGRILDEALPFTTGYACAEVDFDFIENERTRYMKTSIANNYQIVSFAMNLGECTRVYPRTPFVPTNKKQLAQTCERILTMQAYALKKRVAHCKAQKVVIGVSGGSDSTLALVVCIRAMKLLGRPMTDILSVTMPCFGTSSRTLANSIALANAIGTSVMKVDISKAVKQHLDDIGHDLAITDVTYENAQARERTQVLMDLANKTNGMVVGTGDMSELALGWATFNGDHMSMYGVNSGVPKTMVKALLAYQAEISTLEVKRVINDVLATPVSPELLPPKDDKISQVTEDLVGPYVLHDYFLYMFVRKGFSPSKVFTLATITFKDEFSPQEIYKWLDKFIYRFFAQQFKRSCSPDSIKIGTVNLAHGEFLMPADAHYEAWKTDLLKVRPQE